MEIEFVIIQPWPLLLYSMFSDFYMFSGFIYCKVSINMFSRVSWVKNTRKKWYEMSACLYKNAQKPLASLQVGTV
jgi:hypothetical protein